ncbi:MAG: hypothetical protein ACFFEA_04540 [Candidatus Thorarchaeota archaeon]
MSRILSFQLMAILFVLCIVVTPVSAANNQGLHWGVTIGSRFDYHKSAELVLGRPDPSPTEEDFYVIIDSLPSIPDDINKTGDLPRLLGATQFYENGTEIEGSSGWNVLPVGNWSLIVSMWQSWHTNTTEYNVTQDIIITPHLIGYNFTVSDESITSTFADIYVRTTGVLHTSYTRVIDAEIGYDGLIRISLVEGVAWPFPLDSPLGIVGMVMAGAVVILIVLAVLRRE